MTRTGKCGGNSWWVFGRNWFSVYWNRCRVSSAARNFDKMAQTTSYNFLLRTKKSAPLFPLLLLILTAGKTDLLLRKLYRGKLFLKTFFTLHKWTKGNLRYSRYSSGPFLLALKILDHASCVELNFVVLLNFDNILEAPRSTRRNHHCEKGFSQKLDFFGERNVLPSSKLTISVILF